MGKRAGICEYRGCNENYFMMKQQRMSLTQLHSHIVASSPMDLGVI